MTALNLCQELETLRLTLKGQNLGAESVFREVIIRCTNDPYCSILGLDQWPSNFVTLIASYNQKSEGSMKVWI